MTQIHARSCRRVGRAAPVITALLAVLVLAANTPAQEMEARAYSPAPVGANVAVFVYSFQTGDVLFDPAIPLRDVKVNLNAAAVGYGRTFGFFGRQTTASVALPYVWGKVRGSVFEQSQEVTRSGLGDVRVRVAVNLMGSPALSPREFAARKPSTMVGVSLSMVFPTGQYDPRRLVNLGANRFAFKPEVGLSQPVGNWTLELDTGAWFYTDNKEFFGGAVREQKALVSLQGHVIYTLRPRMWLSWDGTYYTGGRTTLNGILNEDLQRNSKIGVTFSLPVTPKHSLKVSWAKGLTALVGGNVNAIAVGWQYVWVK